MRIRNTITEKVVLPLSDKWMRQHIGYFLKFLIKDSFYWNKTQMIAFQNNKLSQLIAHAYNNVPYYTDLFNRLKLKPLDIQTQEDLMKLPILCKKDIKDNYDKFIATNISEHNAYPISSSGSTGEPFKYLVSREAYSISMAASLRGWYWHGFRLGDKYIKLSVNPRSPTIKRIQDAVNNCVYFSSKAFTDTEARRFVDILQNNEIKFIRGYPSTLSLLGNYILSHKIDNIKIQTVFTTGEILFPHMKSIIEKAFDTKVADSYSGDNGATMFTKPGDRIYHVSHEQAITELLHENGKIIDSGKGEVITTNLWNYAMPFIRYNAKDMVKTCKTDTNKMFTVEKIYGRDVDILTTPSGKQLIVHFFTGFFEYINEVDQFQIIQKAADNIILKIIPNESYTKVVQQHIVEKVQEYIGNDVVLEIKLVTQIPLTKAGKRRFVIKETK